MTGYSDLAGLVTFRPLSQPLKTVRHPVCSAFRASWTSTVDLLADELRHLGAKRVLLEVDIRERDIRQDGMPRADARARSQGVILSMDTPHGHLRYEVARFDDWQDNVRAIALGLQALRAVDRYGVTERGEQYAGWKALPSPRDAPSPRRGADIVRQHGGVRPALMATHPDHGGDARAFADVQAYREQAGDAA